MRRSNWYVCGEQEFLRVGQQLAARSSCSEWTAEDWLVFEGLLQRGYVAMSMYPQLLVAMLWSPRYLAVVVMT